MLMYVQIFDAVTSEIVDQCEEEWEDEDDDDEEEDLFHAVVDREARRILFNLLQITYHFIRVYKHKKFNDITDLVAEKFEVNILLFVYILSVLTITFCIQLTSKKKKWRMNKSMRMVLTPYFQAYYSIFSRNEWMKDDGKNNKNGELAAGDMNKVIEAIYAFIRDRFNDYNFWDNKSISKQFRMFIGKACELCWIMVLNTPQLYLYPRIFSAEDVDGGHAKRDYDDNVDRIYNRSSLQEQGDALKSEKSEDIGNLEENEEPKKTKKKKKKKKKKGMEDEDDDKDEEEEMDAIVKGHGQSPFGTAVFTDKYHDCLNEMDEEDEENDNVNINGSAIAYCGWPSLVRKPQLESEQHTQITKTFVYFMQEGAQEFMRKEIHT